MSQDKGADKLAMLSAGLLAKVKAGEKGPAPAPQPTLKTSTKAVDARMIKDMAHEVKQEKRRIKHKKFFTRAEIDFSKKTAKAASSASDAERGAAAVAQIAHEHNEKAADEVKPVKKKKTAVKAQTKKKVDKLAMLSAGLLAKVKAGEKGPAPAPQPTLTSTKAVDARMIKDMAHEVKQ